MTRARVMTPAWSPDGSALIYSYSPSLADGESDLILRFHDEETGLFGAPQLLLDGAEFPGLSHLTSPSWSPDSKYLVTKATAVALVTRYFESGDQLGEVR